MTRHLLVAICLFIIPFTATGGEVAPKAAKFSAPQLALSDALKELQAQTGNTITDLRREPKNPTVNLEPGAFWPTLDAIGKQTGIGFNVYQTNGGIALVDTPYRDRKAHYSGIFRFAIKSTSVTRDDETGVNQCEVVLDTAWEPRFRALFLNLEKAEVAYDAKTASRMAKHEVPAQSAFPVAGKCATQDLKMVLPAPARTTTSLIYLKGAVRVIGVPKLLDFEFTKLGNFKPDTPSRDEKDDVKVSVTAVQIRKTAWTVELGTIYPEGALVKLQSFEEPVLLQYNRVWLTWTDPKTNKAHELDWRGEEPQETKEGTKVKYHFMPRGGTPLPPPGVNVTLRYRTPSRVVAFTVPFAFEDLPLP